MPSSAQVAHLCGVTQGYLGRLLTEQTGWGFVEWRNRIRIDCFVIAWSRSGDLMRAAFDAGFGSYTRFHRVFIDLVGCTPGEWSKGGVDATTGALHAVSSIGSDSQGQRMIWYGLADFVHPGLARWFAPGFAGAMLTNMAAAPERPTAVDVAIDWAALHDETSRLVAEIATTHAEKAEIFRVALARLDHVTRYRDTLGLFFPKTPDLAEVISLYLYVSCYAVIRFATGSVGELANIAHHVRWALFQSGSFARATPADRQHAAAALVAQSSILLGAIEAARSSGNEKKLARIGNLAPAACLATTGVDVGLPEHRAILQ